MTKPAPRLLPEWARHRAIWTAWPHDAAEWGGDLAAPRAEIAALVRALSGGDHVCVLVAAGEAEVSARAALAESAALVPARYGDSWLRDTGPIFARGADGARAALGFRVNGWGGKFVMAGDDEVAGQIAAHAGVALTRHDFVLEGGAIDPDGDGTLLATRQCLLNANRNGWTERNAETALEALGVRKIIWLGDGLANDHTDGHVDNLARFVAPGRVVCPAPSGQDDPNAALFAQTESMLRAARDANGRALEVFTVPSPGRVLDEAGAVTPASHMNFIIGNAIVAVPVYNERGDAAVAALAPLFPGRRVVGLSARAILRGGGAFHCITREEPA
jgi:agmatine deiminase